MLKVASYNIHKGIGLDRRRDPQRVLDVLHEIDADVVALQEADRRFFERRAVIEPSLLAGEGCDFCHVSFDMRPKSIGWHGNAILVKKALSIRHAEPLYLDALEPRGAVLAEVNTPVGPVRVVGMHLDLTGLYRQRQVAHLAEMLLERSKPMPTIIMGDTNEWRSTGGTFALLPERLSLVRCGPSFHTRRPRLELDRIIVSDHLEPVDSGVHVSATAKRASDHLPVWAVLAARGG